MESVARVRAGIAALIVGVIVLVVGLSVSSDGSATETAGLGWPSIVGIVLLILGVVVLIPGIRSRRQEEREVESIRADSTRDTSDDRPS